MPAEFDDRLVYIVSSIRRTRQYVPPAPLLSWNRKKHLNMLDAIALLLVTEDKGDVAAVSFLHNSTSIRFYYTKNRLCTPQETAYVQQLLGMAKTLEFSEIGEWVARALELVVQTCIKKVRRRLWKITGELKRYKGNDMPLLAEDIPNLPIWCETDSKGEFPKAFTKAFPSREPMEHQSDKDILLCYFNGLLRISEPETQIKDIKSAVWLSFHMGPTTSFAGVDMRANDY